MSNAIQSTDKGYLQHALTRKYGSGCIQAKVTPNQFTNGYKIVTIGYKMVRQLVGPITFFNNGLILTILEPSSR